MGIITFQMEAKFNIPICVPNISGNEGRNLSECIQTKFVSSVGKFVDDEVSIGTPSGKLTYEIIEVKHI